VSAGDALNAKNAKTVNGKSLEFGIENGAFKVNGATIRTTDIECDNGVIHVIDAVLLPQSDKSAKAEAAAHNGATIAGKIETAIDRGVPVFNSGKSGECANIYKNCLNGLMKEEVIDPKLRESLQGLMDRANQLECDVERAWLYRAGLDNLYKAVSKS
jgi:hypothetical protein